MKEYNFTKIQHGSGENEKRTSRKKCNIEKLQHE